MFKLENIVKSDNANGIQWDIVVDGEKIGFFRFGESRCVGNVTVEDELHWLGGSFNDLDSVMSHVLDVCNAAYIFAPVTGKINCPSIQHVVVCSVSLGLADAVVCVLDKPAKKRGRPFTGNAMSGAERAKRARQKKKECGLKVINSTLSSDCSARYTLLLEAGFSVEDMIDLAFKVRNDKL